jgi:hypothetical protein
VSRLTIVSSSSGDTDDAEVRVYPVNADKVQLVLSFTSRQFSLVADMLTMRKFVVEMDRQLTHLAEEQEDHGDG